MRTRASGQEEKTVYMYICHMSQVKRTPAKKQRKQQHKRNTISYVGTRRVYPYSHLKIRGVRCCGADVANRSGDLPGPRRPRNVPGPL